MQPPSGTDSITEDMRHSLITAIAELTDIPETDFRDDTNNIPTVAQFRALLPTKEGGLGITDPVTDRYISFPASFINTLPLITRNTSLQKYISDPDMWPDSGSPTLREAHQYLRYASETLRNTAGAIPLTDSTATKTIQTILLATEENQIKIHILQKAAHKHPFKAMSPAFHASLISFSMSDLTWSKEDITAHHTARGPGAAALLNITAIPHHLKLDRKAAQFLICHRLALKLPFLGEDAYCSGTCQRVPQPPSTLGTDHALYGTFRKGYHQASCNHIGLVKYRHDTWMLVLKGGIVRFTRIRGSVIPKDNQAPDSMKTTDLLLTFDDGSMPISLDYTCVCAFLDRYGETLNQPGSDVDTIHIKLYEEKYKKHNTHCALARRRFMPLPGNTQGSYGLPDFWALLDDIWRQAIILEIKEGGTGYRIAWGKQDTMAHLHVVTVKYTAQNLVELNEQRHHRLPAPRTKDKESTQSDKT